MEDKYRFWIYWTLIICVTIILTTITTMIGWVNSPTFSIEMDNNTKEAVMSLNDTMNSFPVIPEYSIYNDSNCQYITERQEWWCTVVG